MTDEERDALRRQMCQLYDHHFAQARARLPVGVPDVLFDGYAVLGALSDEAEARTSAENVSDVLDAVVKLLRAEAAAPTVKAEQVQAMPQEWWQIIHDTLRNYRLTTLVDQDGDGYPLIDAMTADGQPVSDGINECDYLTDAIWNALPTQAPSLPAAGLAVEEAEVAAYRDPSGGLYRDKEIAGIDMRTGRVCGPTALMTVAQHNRIVAALSAQQSAPERVVDCDKALSLLNMAIENHGQWLKLDPFLRDLRALLASHGRGEA